MVTWSIGAVVILVAVAIVLWVTYKITSFITRLIIWVISFLTFAGFVAFLLFKYGILKF